MSGLRLLVRRHLGNLGKGSRSSRDFKGYTLEDISRGKHMIPRKYICISENNKGVNKSNEVSYT